MTQTYNTPQEAEDAYYDALEEGELDRLLAIWADSDDICCLLPMYPMLHGRRGVEDAYRQLLNGGRGVELSIAHLGWIETDNFAIHQVEETVANPGGESPPPPPLYGTNIFRKESDGWRLIVHQNAPTPPPPPPELVMPEQP